MAAWGGNMMRSILKSFSKTELISVLELVDFCLSCEDKSGLDNIVDKLKNLIPFDYSICIHGRFNNNIIEMPYDSVNVNYPEEWVNLYIKKDFHKVDPVFKEHFENFRIQYWGDTYDKIRPPKEFRYLAEDFNLRNGYTYGTRNLRVTKASLISLSGKHMVKEDRIEVILRILAPHMHQVVERVVRKKKLDQTARLTKREQEALKWLAYGKTTWETSVIMGISERTVRFYVESIMHKLDADNRSHAIAIALELGLVELD
jgi:LuxR family transcriptional regulator, quorum-sensing system regulator CviR